MTSPKLEFKLLDRGFKDTLALIPGWATDYRIFMNLELNYNYLLPINFHLFKFGKELLESLNKKRIDKISLFGWSMGGFLAAEFALRNPNRINELILLSICRRFKRDMLEEVKLKLKENAKSYLYKFYAEWFSPWEKESSLWFKKHLLSNYIRQLQLKDLLLGLDYLMHAQINPKLLKTFQKIKVFHGEEDKVVPFEETLRIKSFLSCAEFVPLAQTGHAPFLKPNFKEIFYNGQRRHN